MDIEQLSVRDKLPVGVQPFKSPPFPPSETFVSAVTTSSGIVSDCELCGRTLFEDDETAGDWNDGELERFRQRAKEEPDKVITMDKVHTGDIGGKHVVTNCPCHGLRAYEDFIWMHRHIIAEYIAKKTEAIAQAAYDDEAESEFLKENVCRQDANREFKKCQGGCGGYFYAEAMDGRLFCPRCAATYPPNASSDLLDEPYDGMPF